MAEILQGIRALQAQILERRGGAPIDVADIDADLNEVRGRTDERDA